MPVSGEFLKHYSFCRNSIYQNDRSYLNLAQSYPKLVIKIKDIMFLSSITYIYNFQQELQHNSLEFADIRFLEPPVETSKYQKYFWKFQRIMINTFRTP